MAMKDKRLLEYLRNKSSVVKQVERHNEREREVSPPLLFPLHIQTFGCRQLYNPAK